MHPERVVIARVSAVVATIIVVATVVVATAFGAFGSLLLGHLFPNVQIIIISSGDRPRAWATIVKIIAIPIVLRLGRHLFVILPLDATDAHRPSNGSRNILLLDGVARCDSSGRDTPPQQMRAVLLISTSRLSSHGFTSSIDGSLAP
jgi:hypothetical protein